MNMITEKYLYNIRFFSHFLQMMHTLLDPMCCVVIAEHALKFAFLSFGNCRVENIL